MVQFCDEVAQDILHATGTAAVETVVHNSFRAFLTQKNSYNEKAYIINMIVTLQTIKPQAKSSQGDQNLAHAIKLFRAYNGTEATSLF